MTKHVWLASVEHVMNDTLCVEWPGQEFTTMGAAQDWVERVIEDRGLYQPIAAIKEFALDRYGEITEEELSYWEWAVGMGWYQS